MKDIKNTNVIFGRLEQKQINYSKADLERIDSIVAYADQNTGYIQRVGMVLPDQERSLAKKISEFEHELKHQFSIPLVEGEDLMLYPDLRAKLALQKVEKLKQALARTPKFLM